MSSTIGHFSLYGDFAPEQITELLGMLPSSITPKGTMFEGAERPSKVTDWELYCSEDLTMLEQVEFLIEKFWPVREQLQQLSQEYTADFNISGEGREVMSLKPEHFSKLAQLGIHLNCFFNAENDDVN